MFDATVYNTVKKGLCKSKTESFPIGNGDIGANIWADKEGNINLLISKTDAISELGRLLKVGLIKLKFSTPIFLNEEPDTLLDLSDGSVTVKNSIARVQIAAFRDTSLLAARLRSAEDIRMHAEPIVWRDKLYKHDPADQSARYSSCPFDLYESADVIFAPNTVYHFNEWSYVEYTQKNQHLRQLRDYIKGNCFAYSFESNDDGNTLYINVESDTVNDPLSLATTVKYGAETAAKEDRFETYLLANRRYWTNYFGEYYIRLSGNKDAKDVCKLYTLQKYMSGCANRGRLPIKFNGSIFSVSGADGKEEDYDFRNWAGDYWIQNTRLIYWNMLYSGDFEGMKVLFNFLNSRLPAFKENAYSRYHIDGAMVPETFTVNGTFADSDYHFSQENSEDYGPKNPYISNHFNGMLELSFMMLEFLSYSGQKDYFNSICYPFIKEVLVFFRNRFKIKDGKIHLSHVSALETWWDVDNDAPDVAALKVITERLLALGYNTVIAPEAVPELPTEIKDGRQVLAPCEKRQVDEACNVENPELYSVFPYFIFHSTQSLPQMVSDTYAQRSNRFNNGWSQNLIQAALLLNKEQCEKELPENFRRKAEDYYFDAFFGPNFDWTPDQCHGSSNSIALRMMLLQDKNERVLINPALPSQWEAEFRLPAHNNTVIEHKQP